MYARHRRVRISKLQKNLDWELVNLDVVDGTKFFSISKYPRYCEKYKNPRMRKRLRSFYYWGPNSPRIKKLKFRSYI